MNEYQYKEEEFNSLYKNDSSPLFFEVNIGRFHLHGINNKVINPFLIINFGNKWKFEVKLKFIKVQSIQKPPYKWENWYNTIIEFSDGCCSLMGIAY